MAHVGMAVLLVHALGGCDSAAPPPTTETAGPAPTAGAPISADAPLIVAFGDSLFAGYRLEQDEGFAPALQRELAESGVEAQVFNAGVSGDTSQGGLGRLDFMLDGLPRTPDLVIVELGANDMLRGLDPATTRENLTAILTRLDERGIPFMLAGMVAAPNLGADSASRFNPIYTDLAARFDVPLYPFVLDGVIGNDALMLDDGLHPNPQGVEVMADRIAPLVREAIADET